MSSAVFHGSLHWAPALLGWQTLMTDISPRGHLVAPAFRDILKVIETRNLTPSLNISQAWESVSGLYLEHKSNQWCCQDSSNMKTYEWSYTCLQDYSDLPKSSLHQLPRTRAILGGCQEPEPFWGLFGRRIWSLVKEHQIRDRMVSWEQGWLWTSELWVPTWNGLPGCCAKLQKIVLWACFLIWKMK